MIQEVLNVLGSPDGELSVLIVDDPQIAKLNKEYLHRDGPTNVIAFPQRDDAHLLIPESEEDMPPELLGDVVISTDTAIREAEMGGISTEERFTQLLVHGILHLFGYDHENDEEEASRMAAKSEELLGLLRDIQLC